MSEATLRASTPVLDGTTSAQWPMIANASGVGVIPDLVAAWDSRNMQYAGVLVCSGGAFDLRIRLVNGAVDVTPDFTTPYRQEIVLDAKGYVALVNPAGSTPPAIGGAPGYNVVLSAGAYNGPWPAVDWEVGIFERIPYDPPSPPAGPPTTLGPCPPRPDWPYLQPSITGYQGPIGVMRGARR